MRGAMTIGTESEGGDPACREADNQSSAQSDPWIRLIVAFLAGVGIFTIGHLTLAMLTSHLFASTRLHPIAQLPRCDGCLLGEAEIAIERFTFTAARQLANDWNQSQALDARRAGLGTLADQNNNKRP